ncbi:hypothetical protein [Actinacidiphila oryziradicis]|uniref:Universal stress protein n=1 Tax=Actinacidiphila oryziradicis TaxID=2571141 RepID=A0A4U0T8N9_9ACTN|nr:hypothetical protein [Actinacidiphila oryziradicis]TKA11215.1 hypothetical protein FCI23_12725 [Actinacidiphila oryziradicis]
MSAPERTWPTEVHRRGGGVFVVLPPHGYCPGTVRAAAAYASAAESTLTVAVLLPWPDPFNGFAVSLPYTDFLFDYELQITSELTQLLHTGEVHWNLVLLHYPKQELLSVVRAVDAAVVLVHECRRAWRFSLLRWKARRLAAVVADRTDARVHVICAPWNEFLVREDRPL